MHVEASNTGSEGVGFFDHLFWPPGIRTLFERGANNEHSRHGLGTMNGIKVPRSSP